MNTVLSVQGASAPVKKKSFFSKFTRLNMLRLVRAVIPVAVLMMLFPELAMAAGKDDLMAKGQETVKATWICPYISRHLLSLNPLQARSRRYSR
ncbi:hypothetical protein C9173_23790, partial (plasmid) [Escherichia coli]|uniref:type IV conjugative transfer system pilin TraA n=1 Tax=Escherichia coli TaxID=562 RepID=UPI0011396992